MNDIILCWYLYTFNNYIIELHTGKLEQEAGEQEANFRFVLLRMMNASDSYTDGFAD